MGRAVALGASLEAHMSAHIDPYDCSYVCLLWSSCSFVSPLGIVVDRSPFRRASDSFYVGCAQALSRRVMSHRRVLPLYQTLGRQLIQYLCLDLVLRTRWIQGVARREGILVPASGIILRAPRARATICGLLSD